MKNKKGSVFFTLLFAALLFGAIFIIFITSKSAADLLNGNKKIGTAQFELFNTYQKGEDLQAYLDESARLSIKNATITLAQNGGFSLETFGGNNLIGAPLWYYNGQDLRPFDYKDSFENLFSDTLLYHISSVASLPSHYDIKLDNGCENICISGISLQDMTLFIKEGMDYAYESFGSYDYTQRKKAEKVFSCTNSECVYDVAKYYVDSYGELPYVWGGISPYTYSDTMYEKANVLGSVFNGVYIFPVQPEGSRRSGMPMIPGFDCSGFVWWTLVHTGSPNFKYRVTADGYRDKFDSVLSTGSVEKVCYDDCTKETVLSKAKKGDIIFISDSMTNKRIGHIAIYAGDGKLIESSGDKGLVYRDIPFSYFSRHPIQSVYRIVKFS